MKWLERLIALIVALPDHVRRLPTHGCDQMRLRSIALWLLVGTTAIVVSVWALSVVAVFHVSWPGRVFVGVEPSVIYCTFYVPNTGMAEDMREYPAASWEWSERKIGWRTLLGELPSIEGGRRDEYWCISAPMWLPVVLLLSTALFILRYNRRRDCIGSCPRCGYNLTGNVSGVCPECGNAVPDRE